MKIFQVVKKSIVHVVEDVVNFTVRKKPRVAVMSRYRNTSAGRSDGSADTETTASGEPDKPAAESGAATAAQWRTGDHDRPPSDPAYSSMAVGQGDAAKPVGFGQAVYMSIARLMVMALTAPAASAWRTGDHGKPPAEAAPSSAGQGSGDVRRAPNDGDAAVVERFIELTRLYGASSASASGDWESAANAEGKQDGATAECRSGGLSQSNGTLTLSYPVTQGKDAMTIDRVLVRAWYAHESGLRADVTTITANGPAGELKNIDSNQTIDFLSSPEEFDITAAVAGDYGNIPTQIDVLADHGIGTANATVVDAIEILVEASQVEAL